MDESRTTYVKRNVFYSYAGTIITSLLAVICRTLFVYKLGVEYLGVSGLFSNVLGILSFSELGIGSAIVFSLYKPIAENNHEKIKSLLKLYKIAYRVIALVVTVIGVLLVPFLKYLLNTEIPMDEIYIFYAIFLFNTVSSYFVSYKTSYVSAIQKNYIVTNTNTIGTIVVDVLQIVALLLGGSYLVYLLIAAVVGLFQKIATVIYLNNRYPILVEKDVKKLDSTTKNGIWKNVKALIIHKIGDVSVHQTDNIIVSAFVSTNAVGLISNYTTLNSLVATFTNGLFNSFTASFGNLIAKESKQRQYEIFEMYDLMGFWVFGFVMIAFITLSQPFITLWLGGGMIVDNITVILYFVSIYLASMTLIPYNFKIAAGRFDEDKWVAFVQAIVNIIVSIAAVKAIGLPGVYVGTIVQRIIVIVVRPYIVYHYVLDKSVIPYHIRFVLRTLLVGCICVLMWKIKSIILYKITIPRFVFMVVMTVIIPNLIFFIIYGRTNEFKGIVSKMKKKR
jgi:O-antigen/teichoic acid export membrane protein